MNKLIHDKLYLSLLALVVFILFIPPVFFPFIFGKGILLMAGLTILVSLIFIFCPRTLLNFRPSWVTVSLGAFLLLLLITSLTSQNPYRSFWGSFERMDGFFQHLHYAALALLGAILLGASARRRHIWIGLITVGVAVSFYALGQKLGLLPHYGYGTVRVISLIGNPIFLGAFLAPLILIAAAIFWEERWRGWGPWMLLAIVILLGGFLSAASRGPILGILSGAGVLALGIHIQKRKIPFKKIKPWLIGGALGLVVLAWILVASGLLGSLASRDPAAQNRIFMWQIALEALKEKPVLGWGLDNYNYAVDKFFNPGFYREPQSETWFDHPHNVFLGYAVAGGVPLLFFYSALILVSAWFLLRRGGLFNWGVLAALVGHSVQNVFGIESPSTFFIFYLMVSQAHWAELEYRKIKPQRRLSGLSSGQKVTLAGTGVLIMVLFGWLHISSWKAGRAFQSGMLMSELARPVQARQFYDKAFISPFGHYDIYDRIGSLAIDVSSRVVPASASEEQKSEYKKNTVRTLADAFVYLDQSTQIWPNLSRHYIIKGLLINKLYQLTKEPQLIKFGKEAFRKAQEISPARPQIYLNLAQLYALENNFKQAAALVQKAIELSPSVAHSYATLGLILKEAGDEEAANKAFLKAVELRPDLKKELPF